MPTDEYNGVKAVKYQDCPMKKMLGFIAVLLAVGMLLMLITHNRLVGLVIIALLLFVGYSCVCGD